MEKQIEQKLLLFERQILRKIFGPNKESDGSCSIKTNGELDKLTSKNVVREINSRFAWIGHVPLFRPALNFFMNGILILDREEGLK